MTKVYDDLMAAFAGESQANRKYLAFAKKADRGWFYASGTPFPGSRRSGNRACPHPLPHR